MCCTGNQHESSQQGPKYKAETVTPQMLEMQYIGHPHNLCMKADLDTSCLLVQFQLNLGALISLRLIKNHSFALSHLHFLPTADKKPSQPSAYLILR